MKFDVSKQLTEVSLLSSGSEMVDCFNDLAADPDCRVVVVSGAGRLFTAGGDPTFLPFRIVLFSESCVS